MHIRKLVIAGFVAFTAFTGSVNAQESVTVKLINNNDITISNKGEAIGYCRTVGNGVQNKINWVRQWIWRHTDGGTDRVHDVSDLSELKTFSYEGGTAHMKEIEVLGDQLALEVRRAVQSDQDFVGVAFRCADVQYNIMQSLQMKYADLQRDAMQVSGVTEYLP